MRRCGILVGMALIIAGIAVGAWQYSVRQAYASLEESVIRDAPYRDAGTDTDDSDGSAVDWPSLRQANPAVSAWVIVEGTDISLPVVTAQDKEHGYYLTHDLWGRPALEGTPFLDHRCRADGQHRLVFGHHLTTGGQFSELHGAFEQDVFDQLGTCFWCTPEGGVTRLEPLCALRVESSFEDIQRFEFSDETELHAWLGCLEAQATARTKESAALARRAKSLVSLVTCSSEIAGQPWRTLVVFAEAPPETSP